MVHFPTKRQREAVATQLEHGRSARTVALQRGVSDRTVREVAKRSGLKYLAFMRSAPLTDAHRTARMAFAKKHKRTDWARVRLTASHWPLY